jgi:hypothetical protein
MGSSSWFANSRKQKVKLIQKHTTSNANKPAFHAVRANRVNISSGINIRSCHGDHEARALVSVAQTPRRIRCKTGFVRINGARIGEANSRELVS